MKLSATIRKYGVSEAEKNGALFDFIEYLDVPIDPENEHSINLYEMITTLEEMGKSKEEIADWLKEQGV